MGSITGRVDSIQRDGNHNIVLQWLVADGNERIAHGQKLFAERLFDMWKDFRPVEKEFPTIIFRDWVFKVSQRSPLDVW
jgi:hypothetical protein